MNPLKYGGRPLAFALALCASSAASAQDSETPIEDTLKQIQAQIDALNKKGQMTVTPGATVIESWLLSSRAVDAAAEKIKAAVVAAPGYKASPPILVLAGSESIDFGQIALLQLEIDSLTARFNQLSRSRGPSTSAVPIAAIASLIGLLKTETTIEAIPQTVDSKILASAVAAKLQARIPTAAILSVEGAPLLGSFRALMEAADHASVSATKEQQDELKTLIARYDALSTRVLTPKDGVAPLAYAARLQSLSKDGQLVLAVNTENSSGTLLKRANLVTALGGESVFISGGLVSSYRLTDPKDGRVLAAGVVICRTTLTSLKNVQSGSWQSPHQPIESAVCLR